MNNYKIRLKKNIPLFYAVNFLSFLIFFVPIWVAYERQFITFTQMSLISASRFALTAFLELPTGALADLIGRKYSVMLGFLVEAFGLIIIAQALNANYIIIAAIFRGVGDALRSGADTALIYDSLLERNNEKDFSKIMSTNNLFTQAGLIVSSILAGYLFDLYKPLPYLVYSICLILAAIITLIMQEPKIDTEKFTLKNYIEQTKIGIRETLANSYVKKLTLFYSLVGGLTWSTQIFLNQIYASSIGYTELGKSWLFAIIRFINSFIIIKLLRIDKFIDKFGAFLFFPLIIIISTLPAIISDKTMGTILLFTMTISSTLRFIILDKVTNKEFRSKYRATAVSTLNLYVSLVYILIVSLSGTIIDNLGTGSLYTILGILSLLIILPIGLSLHNKTQ
ncbi:MFS transporter [Candidatus Dojkabacteria bacterium]|nr:MFS transporter [Candidatus Dojkabacteria bacterium]